MTTTVRLYYSSVTAAPVSPAFDPAWEVTGSAVRRKLKTTPAGTGSSGAVAAAETSTSIVDLLNGQFTSDSDVFPTDGRILAGSFDSVMGCRASGSGAADMFQQIMVHIFDTTGATNLGTIFPGLSQTAVSATASDPNGEFGFSIQETRILDDAALSGSVVAASGQKVVVEFGARACNVSSTSRTSTIDFRDDGVADHPLTAGITTNGRPWIEFHLIDPCGVPTSVVTDPDITTIDVDWAAPATGDAPTSYEVRIDGGSATDVGLALTHTFTGLTPNTLYDVEVRAKNAAGASAWVSVPTTTDLGAPGVPTSLSVDADVNALELHWSAPVTGGVPSGYDVRIDGGAPVDVGLVTSYQFTGLDPETTYTLEVRAYNIAGDSAWEGISGETLAEPPDPGVVTEAEYASFIVNHHSIRVTVDVLTLDHVHISNISHVLLDGQVTVDADAEITRSANLVFLDPSHSLNFDSDSPADGALYADRMIRVTYGIRPYGGGWVDVPVFTGPVVKFERDGATVTVECQGKELLAKGAAMRTATYAKGGNKATTIRSILANEGERFFSIPTIAAKLPAPRSIVPTTEPWRVARSIARSMGRQLFYDGAGRATLRKPSTRSIYTFRTGDGGEVLSVPKVAYLMDDVKNAVKVVGATPKGQKTPITFTAVAPASHPLSPWRLGRNSQPRYLLDVVNNPSIRSRTEAKAVANARLDRLLKQTVEVEFDSMVVATLKEGDWATLRTDEFAVTFRLKTFTIPLHVSGRMQIGYTRRRRPNRRAIR